MSRFSPLLLSLAGACILVCAPAAHAGPVNDNRADALPIAIDSQYGDSNRGATIEGREPLTPLDSAKEGCDDSVHGAAPASAGALRMQSTIWYQVVGDGRTLTAFTDGSQIDTLLGVYRGNSSSAPVTCSDDFPWSPPGSGYSEVRFAAARGVVYQLQLGGCAQADCAPYALDGDIEGGTALTVVAPPANDRRTSEQPLSIGTPITDAHNVGATENAPGEPSELLNCNGSPYGKTVWYRVSVPSTGTLSVRASADEQDSVLAVYPLHAAAPLACNDDATVAGPARVDVNVGPGDYEVQVGGYGDGVDASDGRFTVSADFQQSFDLDGDGVAGSPVGADCDDHNSAIHPGAPEIPNNDVDENCDRIKAQDADHDGHLAPPAGDDCDDTNAKIYPGAPSIIGNRIKENCVTDPPYQRVTGQPRVRYAFFKHPPTIRVVRIYVQTVQKGSTVTFTCSGRGCPPRRRIVVHVTRSRAKLTFNVRFRHRLRRASQLVLRIAHRDQIGAVRVIQVTRRSFDDRTLCWWPNEKRPRRCV